MGKNLKRITAFCLFFLLILNGLPAAEDYQNDNFDEDPAYRLNLQVLPGMDLTGHSREKATNNFLFGFFVGMGHNVWGLGLGFLGLVNSGYIRGAQLSGLFNYTEENIKGLQASGFFNIAGANVKGVQAAGIFNITKGEVLGHQGSFIFNYAGETRGLQMSIVNINKGGSGAQIGIVNISKSEKIIPIGFVNIIKNGIIHPAVYLDDMFFSNVSFRSGSKHFYTLLSAGTKAERFLNTSEDRLLAARAGFGFEYSINRVFFNIDASAGSIINLERININSNTDICQLRFIVGYKIYEHLAFFGGLSYDYLHLRKNTSPDPRDFGGPVIGKDFGRYIHKLGIIGGIQF